MLLPITLGKVTSARSELIPHSTASIKLAVKINRFIVVLSQEDTLPGSTWRDDHTRVMIPVGTPWCQYHEKGARGWRLGAGKSEIRMTKREITNDKKQITNKS
jgi:hypothetical protein